MKEMNQVDLIIGYRLKQFRLAKGYTQSKVADVLGVSPQHYGTLERGVNSLSLDNVLKICDFYAIPITDIIGEVRLFDRKKKKEEKKLTEHIEALNDEHKEAIKQMVKFYTQLEQRTGGVRGKVIKVASSKNKKRVKG